MNNENKKRKLIPIIIAAVLLLIALLFGLSKCSGLANNTMTVYETQDNSLYIPTYDENESSVFTFLPAKDAQGDVTYELISAKDSEFKDVDYFTLLSSTDTQILVAKGTPAGVYTLKIRAHATGDSAHKEADKDITYIYTIGKAASEYTTVPSAVEGLIYNGKDQALVHGGSSPYGTILYKVNDGEWSEELPTGLDAGVYTVFYKLAGDNNHEDIKEQSFLVSIGKKSTGYKPGSYSTGTTGITTSSSLSGLINYVKEKSENASNNKQAVSGKPGTYVEYVYDGNEHNNGYRAPSGITMVGDDRGIKAGTYIAIYTPDKNYCWSDGTRTPVQVKMVIKRKEFAKPTVNDVLVYNGEVQYADIVGFDEQAMKVIGNNGKNAGTYIAIVSLKDKQNYKWTDNTITDVKLEWHIFPKGVDIPNVTTTYVFKGGMKRVGSIVTEVKKYQTVNEEDFDKFDPDLIKIVRGNTHADAGDYEIEIALKDKHNYKWNDEEGGSNNRLVSWTIERKPIGDKPEDRTVPYNGCVQTNGYRKPDEVAVTGDYKGKEVGEYIATYTPYSNYCWSDDKSASPVEVKLTIISAGIDKPKTYVETTYNGHVQTNGYDKPDGVDILPGGSDRGIDAGTYTAVYVPDANHVWSDGSGNEPVTVTLKIKKARLDVPTIVGDSSFAYDGEKHHVEITGYNNNLMKMSGDFGSKKYVGDYSITISLRDKAKQNYEWDTDIEDDTSDKILKWSITSNGVTVPTVNKEFVYNGKWQHVEEEDLNNFDRKLMKIVNKENGKDAGDYKIWVGLKDKDGYYWEDGTTDDQELTWTIKQAENPLSVIGSQVIVTSYNPYDHKVFFVAATDAVGDVTYELTSARKQGSQESAIDRFELDGTNITIKGNTDAGIYYLTVKVNAAGDNNYKSASKDINIVLTNNGKRYVVEFNGNGASGSMENQNVFATLIGMPLDGNEFVKEGYEFEKWTTNPDGTGESFKNRQYVTYDDLTKCQEEGIVKLYAQWKLKKFKITYKNVDSYDGVTEFDVTTTPFKLTKPERRGYDFVGWSGTGLSEITEDVTVNPLDPASDRVYTANWKAKEYTILYINIDVGTIGHQDAPPFVKAGKKVTFGEKYGQLDDAEYREYYKGYEVSWRTVTGGLVTPDATVDSVLDNGTAEAIKNIIHGYLPDNAIIRGIADAIFNVAINAMDAADSNNILPIFANRTAYTNVPYTVNHYIQKLDSNDYETEPFKTETRYGTTDEVIDYKEQQIKITGFKFANGSYSGPGNSPTVLADGNRIINIYYDRYIYTVSFNSRGGKDVASQEIPYQGLVTEPDLKERTDKEGNTYSLIGWYYDGKLFDFRNERVKGDMTLVAEWEKSVYVEAVSNNSKFGTALGTGSYRNGETVTLRGLPEENHRFIMWEDAEGKEVSTDSEYSFTVTQEMIDAGTGMKFVAVFEEIDSKSLALYEEMTFHADPGAEIGISDLYLSNLVRRYDASTEEDSPLSLRTEGIAFVDAYIEVAENAQPGTYVIDVTAVPRLLDFYHKRSTIRITVIVNDNLPIVTFDSKGGTDVSEQKVDENGHVARPADPYREGYVFMGWYLGDAEEQFDFDKEISHDIELVAKWGHKVIFDANGGSFDETTTIVEQIVEHGGKAVKPEIDPKNEGLDFRWSLNGKPFDFNSPINSNITLLAIWKEQTVTIEVTSNNANYGEVTGSGIYIVGSDVTIEAQANNGYVFVGWDINGDGVEDEGYEETTLVIKNVKADATYKAIFTSLNDIIKQFVLNPYKEYLYEKEYDGSNPKDGSINIEENFNSSNFGVLYRAYDWGWFNVKYEPAENNPLSFKFERKGRIGKYNYHLNIIVDKDAEPGDYSVLFNIGIPGTSLTIPCKYTVHIADAYYDVEFLDPDTGKSIAPTQKISNGGYVTRPIDPIKTGSEFNGWYIVNNGNKVPFDFKNTQVHDDLRIYADWLHAEIVTFVVDNEVYDEQTVKTGEKAVRPADPVSEDRKFDGWYKDNVSLFNFETPITGKTDLYAWWKDAVTVSFDTLGGTPVASQTVELNSEGYGYVVRPADPVLTGYNFLGWSLNDEWFDFNSPINSNIKLEANWQIKSNYTVYYDVKGIDPIDNVKWNQKGLLPAETPSRLGYRFSGWYVDEKHTVPYNNQTYAELAYYDDSITSVTLYGSWFKIDLIDYKATMYSYEGDIGEDAIFEIKDESRWYLVFDEYEIVGGNEDNVIRMTADKNHLVMSDKALPGTYYVEVKAIPSSILKYFGIDFDLSSLNVIPEDIQELLDKYSQTLLVEWTVLERPDEDFGTFDNGEDGGMGVYSTYSDGEDGDQGLFSAPGYYADNTVIDDSDEDDDNNTGDGNITTEGGNILQEGDPNNEVFIPNDDSGDDGTGTDNVEE